MRSSSRTLRPPRAARVAAVALIVGSLTLVARTACAAEAAATDSTATRTAEERELPPPGVRAWQTGLLRPDRIEHASLAFTIGLATGLATRKPAAAFGVPAALGLGKEVADRSGTGFDLVDLAADLLGAAAAASLTSIW